jgi:hypothetical protein
MIRTFRAELVKLRRRRVVVLTAAATILFPRSAAETGGGVVFSPLDGAAVPCQRRGFLSRCPT